MLKLAGDDALVAAEQREIVPAMADLSAPRNRLGYPPLNSSSRLRFLRHSEE